jgi:hypothetical protein
VAVSAPGKATPPIAAGGVALLIQHHPSRSEALARLLASLVAPGATATSAQNEASAEGNDVDTGAIIIHDPAPYDRPPNAMRTYRACLEAIPAEASHAFIVQDDVICPPGFMEAATAAVATHPDRLIALWHGGQPGHNAQRIRRAIRERRPFTELATGAWVPTVCLAWPADAAREFLQWIEGTKYIEPRWRTDDPAVGEWTRKTRRGALATAPSLCEHPDDLPSVMGVKHRAGGHYGRVAAVYTGEVATWLGLL